MVTFLTLRNPFLRLRQLGIWGIGNKKDGAEQGGDRYLKISTVTITRRMLLSSTDFDIFDCGMIVGVGPPTTYQLQRHNAKSFTFLPFQMLYPTVSGLSNLLKMSSTQILCDEARKALKWLWSRSRSRQKQRRQHLLSTFGALKTFIWKLTAH